MEAGQRPALPGPGRHGTGGQLLAAILERLDLGEHPRRNRHGQHPNVLNLVFASPVSTSRIRFYSTESVVRLREWRSSDQWPCRLPRRHRRDAEPGQKRPATASSVDANNYAKGAVDGYVDDAARWKSAEVNGPHTLEVELLESSRVGSAHLYTGSATGPPISDFTVEAWTGSAWTVFPGGAVTGNTNPASS